MPASAPTGRRSMPRSPSFAPKGCTKIYREKGKRRGRLIGIRVTPDEFAGVEARAAAAGLSLSAYGRAAFSGDSVRVIMSQSAPPEIIRQLRYMGNNVKQALHEARTGNFPGPVA